MSLLRVRAWINRFSALSQVIGAEGLSVNASNFLIEDLAIEDTTVTRAKVNEGDNITIRRCVPNGPTDQTQKTARMAFILCKPQTSC